MVATSISLASQTAYADLVERCFDAAFEDDFAEDGAFVAKTVNGRRYWYFQTSNNARRQQKYVGPETEELLEQIDRHKYIRGDERDRRAVVSMLVRSASLPQPIGRIGEVVAALQRAGVFRLRGVLVGTTAYQAYAAMLGIRLPRMTVQTGDVDIAQHRTVSVAVEDAMQLPLDVLRDVDASFRETPNIHGSNRTTSYQAVGGLRVDFLTPNQGADTDKPTALPSLATDAQPLRFLDYLIHEPMRAVLLHGAGVPVLVPAPERFAIHKLIIAQRRSGAQEKRGKDLAQAEALLNVLSEHHADRLSDAWREAWERGKSWRGLLGGGLKLIKVEVRDATLRAIGETRSIVPGVDLKFTAPRVRYDFDRDVLTFFGEELGERRRCAVSWEVLDDHFGADAPGQESMVRAFKENRSAIERLLRTKYLFAPVEKGNETLLVTDDIPRLRALVEN